MSCPIIISVGSSPVSIEVSAKPACIVEVGTPGPSGPQGPVGPQGLPGIGIVVSDYRMYQDLVGTKDGVNTTFTLPSSETAINAPPGMQVQVFFNGQQIFPGIGNDFTIAESGGVGTGFDEITTAFAPLANDALWAHYVLSP